jgi:hypothetical protein
MLKAIVTFIYKEIDMVTNNEIGELEIINLPRLHPFVVKFENFEEANAIQVDVAGIGAFVILHQFQMIFCYKYIQISIKIKDLR